MSELCYSLRKKRSTKGAKRQPLSPMCIPGTIIPELPDDINFVPGRMY